MQDALTEADGRSGRGVGGAGPGAARFTAWCVAACAALLLAACGSTPPAPTSDAGASPVAAPAAATHAEPARSAGKIAGTHPQALVYLPAPGETLAAIAQRVLGDASLAWIIAQANGDIDKPRAGHPLIVPRQAPSPLGVAPEGLQTVPVLCYHRFTDADTARGNKMLMPASRFEAQLAFLQRERFTVLRMGELTEFLQGRRAVPPRSVVITIDDGWNSFYRWGYPLLQKYRMPATLFVYTDVIGTRDGLSWAQLREMAQSGWVDIQAHSKTHRNLTERNPGESEAAWRRALVTELQQPRQVIEKQLADVPVKVQYLAYPFGDANDGVLQALAAEPYSLAFTVRAGGNPFFAPQQLLRRTMIYGDHTIEDFAARLQTRRPLAKP